MNTRVKVSNEKLLRYTSTIIFIFKRIIIIQIIIYLINYLPNYLITNYPSNECKRRNFYLCLLDKYQNITMRSCQTAKTETVDPCKSINAMIPTLTTDDKKLEFCELCTEDACNSSITISPTISFTLLSALGAVILGCFYNSA